MHKVHVIKLKPTSTQIDFFSNSVGVSRFVYNWALNKWVEDFKKGIKWTGYDLRKYLNSIKKEQFPWMYYVSKNCSDRPIINLETAFKRFWKKQNEFPKFKKKGVKDSFLAVESKRAFKQQNHKIWIPKLGWVKCHEDLRFEGKVNNVIIKRIADMWFAIINIEVPVEIPKVCENQVTIGIDMGIKSMLILSDGIIYENPRALKSNLRRLKIRQRRLSKKQKDSSNRYKEQMKVARHHYKISNIRNNAIHNATSEIVRKYDRIVIETLKPENMVKNHKLAQAINDVSFGEISRQLAYKALWAGKELVKADQWFASSKLCSGCGHKKETLKLSQREYQCENCGLLIDRDLNAAKNLANYCPTSENGESYASGELTLVDSVNEEIVNYKLDENSIF